MNTNGLLLLKETYHADRYNIFKTDVILITPKSENDVRL